jgi:FkbM family methyltransferase
MSQGFVKSLALKAIANGLRLPQPPIDRINELVLFKDLLEQLKADCVLDVGANRGQFAYELRGIGYTGAIISFEPVSTEFKALQERFSGDTKWKGYQMALGASSGSMTINVSKDSVMSSMLETIHAEKDVRRETVDIRRLDEMLPSLQRDFAFSRPFLKMDTQGFDLEVFKGATGCVSQIQGIQSELSIQPLYKGMPHYLEALQTYEAAGFDLFNLSVVNRIETGGLLELNCFMRRSSPK